MITKIAPTRSCPKISMTASWRIVPGAVGYAKVSPFMTRGSTSTRIHLCPAPCTPHIHIEQPIISTSYVLDPTPFFCRLVVLCVSFLWRTSMYISSTFDVSLSDVSAPPPSPYAGSPTGGSRVPWSSKPSAEGTTVCLSSDSVQQKDGGGWIVGTIQTWDASAVLVRFRYSEAKYELATVRQYRSAKQCSSIQPGTESFFSIPNPIPRKYPPLARIKGSLFHLQALRFPPLLSLVAYNADTHTHTQ